MTKSKYATEEERQAAEQRRRAAVSAANRARGLKRTPEQVREAKRVGQIAWRKRHPNYYQENREKLLAYGAEYRESNKEKTSERMAKYNARPEVQERARAAHLAWTRANRDKVAAQFQRRYAEKGEQIRLASKLRGHRRRILTSDGDFTEEDWLDLLTEFDYHCAYCNLTPDRLEIEHVVPVSRGGKHTKSNIVPACRGCNASKGAKLLFEWLASA